MEVIKEPLLHIIGTLLLAKLLKKVHLKQQKNDFGV